jgi:hypothetical protein
VLRGAGPTTGVTIVKGESAVCAWNGSDFIKISNTSGAGVFTTLSVAGAVTLSGGTANGVAYLNGSKVLTTGSALVFDGTKLTSSASGAISGVFNRNTSSGATLDIQVVGGSVGTLGSDTGGNGRFDIVAATALQLRAVSAFMSFDTNGSTRMTLDSSGNLGIGATSPSAEGKLTVGTTTVTDKNGIIFNRGAAGTPSATQGAMFYELNGIGSAESFTFRSSGGYKFQNTSGATTWATLDSSGNLGIGATNPTYRLDVFQDQNANSWARVRNATSGSSAYAGIMVNASGNSWGMRMGSSAANSNALEFVLDAAGTPSPKMTLDASGRLLVGTTTSPSSADIKNVLSSGNGAFTQYSYNGGPGGVVGTTSDSTLSFFTYTGNIGSETYTERARFNSTGAFVFAGGTTTANGIGITFPATQSASTNANTLDDYEEGTFTPTCTLTTPGTSFSGSIVGVYTKVGNLVTVTARLTFTKGTGSGDFVFGGLPFTSNSTATYQNSGAISLDDLGVAGKVYYFILANNTTAPNLLSITQAGGVAAVAGSTDFVSSCGIRYVFTYQV